MEWDGREQMATASKCSQFEKRSERDCVRRTQTRTHIQHISHHLQYLFLFFFHSFFSLLVLCES